MAEAQTENHHEEDVIPHDLKTAHTGWIIVLVLGLVLLLVVLFLVGYIPWHSQQKHLAAQAQDIRDEVPQVDAAPPKSDSSPIRLALPGNTRAWQETSLFARTDGFLAKWNHDIGDKVEIHEVLGKLSAPDLDAQVDQAAAALEQAKADVSNMQNNYNLTETTFNRNKNLLPTGDITQQQLDTYETQRNQGKASLTAAQAAQDSAAATLKRLQAQQGFETISAPFPGTVTARNYDVGALISAANNSPGKEVFKIAETDRLRIFANVPQTYVSLLHENQEVKFEVPNYPGQVFTGKLARTAGAIDTATRTLLTEVDFDNKDGRLWAGMYGTLTFEIPRASPMLTVPTSALLFEAEGTEVAVVESSGDHSVVKFKSIKIGRDLGPELEITSGLAASDKVVTNPGEHLTDGTAVKLSDPSAPPAVAGSGK